MINILSRDRLFVKTFLLLQTWTRFRITSEKPQTGLWGEWESFIVFYLLRVILVKGNNCKYVLMKVKSIQKINTFEKWKLFCLMTDHFFQFSFWLLAMFIKFIMMPRTLILMLPTLSVFLHTLTWGWGSSGRFCVC